MNHHQVQRIVLGVLLLWGSGRIQQVQSQRGASSYDDHVAARFGTGEFRRVTRMRLLDKDAKTKDAKSKGHNIFDKHHEEVVLETDAEPGADAPNNTVVVVQHKGKGIFPHTSTTKAKDTKAPKDWKSSRAPQYFKGYHETKSMSKTNAFDKEQGEQELPSPSSSSKKDSKSKDVKHPYFFPYYDHNTTASPIYNVHKGKGKSKGRPDYLERKEVDDDHSNHSTKRGKRLMVGKGGSSSGGSSISKGKGVSSNTTLAPSFEVPSKGKGKGIMPPPIYIPHDKKPKSSKSHSMGMIVKKYPTASPSTSAPTTRTRLPTRPPVPTFTPTTGAPQTNPPTRAPVPTVSPTTSPPTNSVPPQTSTPTICDFFGGLPQEVCIAIDESGSVCGAGLCNQCDCFENPNPIPIDPPDDCCENFRHAIEFSVDLLQGYDTQVQDLRAAVSYFSTRTNNPEATLTSSQEVIDDLVRDICFLFHHSPCHHHS